MKRLKQRWLLLCFLGFLIVGFAIVLWGQYKHYRYTNNSIGISDDYLSLFNLSAQQHFCLELSTTSDFFSPYTDIMYGNKNGVTHNYSIVIHKLSILNPKNSLSYFILEDSSLNIGKESEYSKLVLNYYFFYKTIKYENNNKIYLTLIGDSIKSICKNDSIYCYYLNFHNISIRSKKNGTADFMVSSEWNKYNLEKMPAEIAFIKKNNSIYFLLVTVAEQKNIDPNFLQNLLWNFNGKKPL